MLKDFCSTTYIPIEQMNVVLSVYAKQTNARYKIMLLTTKSGRVVEMPTDEEDALINAAIESDSDTYEVSAADFSKLKRIGRPPAEMTKARITMRIDKDTLSIFKSRAEMTGDNYQTFLDSTNKCNSFLTGKKVVS